MDYSTKRDVNDRVHCDGDACAHPDDCSCDCAACASAAVPAPVAS